MLFELKFTREQIIYIANSLDIILTNCEEYALSAADYWTLLKIHSKFAKVLVDTAK